MIPWAKSAEEAAERGGEARAGAPADGQAIGEAVNPNTSEVYFKINSDDVIKSKDIKNLVFTAGFKVENKTQAKSVYYFVPPKELLLTEPKIVTSAKAGNNGYSIILEADKLAKNVYLSTDEDGFFSDNYFDLLPGVRVKINFITDKKISVLNEKIRIISLKDTYLGLNQ